MATVFQPRSSHGNMICRTFTLCLDQDGEILVILAIPLAERFQELKTIRFRADDDIHSRSILGRSSVRVFTGIKALGRQSLTCRYIEFEFLAIRALEGIGHGIKVECSSKDHGGNEIGGSDKGMGSRVGIVTSSKVSVVGRDDGILFALFDVMAVPLADTGSTGIGKDHPASLLERGELTVSCDCRADLFGAGGDGELRLDFEAVFEGLAGDGGGAGHVLVGGVCARSNESDFEFFRPAMFLDGFLEFGDWGGEIGREGAVDVGFQGIQVDFDELIVFAAFVGGERFSVGLGVFGNVAAFGADEVICHAVVEAEDRGGGSDFGAHVANGAHARAGEGIDTGAVVFDDGAGAALDSQDTSDLEDDVCCQLRVE